MCFCPASAAAARREQALALTRRYAEVHRLDRVRGATVGVELGDGYEPFPVMVSALTNVYRGGTAAP
jgi:hypothetical protein